MEVFRANLQLLEDQPGSSLSAGGQQVMVPGPLSGPLSGPLPGPLLNNNSLHQPHHQPQGQILKQFQLADLSVPPAPAQVPVVMSKLKAAPTLISLQSARDHKFMPY